MEMKLQDGGQSKNMLVMSNICYKKRQHHQTSIVLKISVENPWMAVSPDGLVHDPSVDPPDGIVKYKNSYAARNIALTEAITKAKSFCLVNNKENQLELIITTITYSVLCSAHSVHGVTL